MLYSLSYQMLFVVDFSELIIELVLGVLLVVLLHVFSYTAALCLTREQAVCSALLPSCDALPWGYRHQASWSWVLCCRWQAKQTKVTFLPNI